MNRFLASHDAAGHLNRAIGDHFVGVHVGLGAAAGLPNAQRKMLVKLSFDHFVARLHDQGLPCLSASFAEVSRSPAQRLF